jgi:hypothetical protein
MKKNNLFIPKSLFRITYLILSYHKLYDNILHQLTRRFYTQLPDFSFKFGSLFIVKRETLISYFQLN